MDYSHFSILLLLLSLALLAAEVFLPSGGFIAVLMLLSLAGSVFCAFRAWWETHPTLWWIYIASVLVLLPLVLIAAFTIFPRTPYGRRILLHAPEPDEITPYAREQSELHQLVGRHGKTVTAHRPSGMLIVDGVRHHSETRGTVLDPGESVEIIAVRGNRLVIRPFANPNSDRDTVAEFADNSQNEPAKPSSEAAADVPFDPFLGESEKV